VLPPVKLYQGVAPGSEGWTIPETTAGQSPGRIVRNVVSPDYVPYLPDASRNTGTGVVIAPGGGFVMLSYDSEGVEVAKWLAERGIAAFVLKYRVRQTDPGQSPMAAIKAADEPTSNYEFGVADGAAAVKLIRQRAAEYGARPDKIVMVGFSAGAIVTVSTALQSDLSARPNYAAPIYGAPFGSIPELPQGLPPFFLAIAQDDNGAGALVDRFYAALLAKGYRPELHRFQSGGHGFGMNKRFTTADHWIDEFFWWLEANDLTRKPGDPERPLGLTPTGRSGRGGASR
jgi:acetyl esterase/lipase